MSNILTHSSNINKAISNYIFSKYKFESIKVNIFTQIDDINISYILKLNLNNTILEFYIPEDSKLLTYHIHNIVDNLPETNPELFI